MTRMKSVMQHVFSQIPDVTLQRSKFNRSHGYKTTFDENYLVPIFVDEALPGDTFNVKMTALCRMATPLKPIMDNLYLDTFFFAVPNRLVWEHWQNFMGERDSDQDDPNDYAIPEMTAPAVTGYTVGSLSDYFGIPTGVPLLVHSALFHRAYNLIFNEWFRSQDFINKVTVDKGDSSSNPANYVLLKRGKRHDYFTSCLPWPQKGDSVLLPLGNTAPVVSNGGNIYLQNATDSTDRAWKTLNDATPGLRMGLSTQPNSSDLTRFGSETGLEVDLEDATASNINELRQAFQIQRMLERDARGGTRYIEVIRSHFGVISPDARLQRPEYLGGGSTPIIINPVVQNSVGTYDASGNLTTTPQGNLAAIGTGHSVHGFTKSFTEHCLIIGLVNVRADLTYQQGLDRMWCRSTRYDFYWPSLSHLGEQAVLNKEIFAKGPAAHDASGNDIDEKVFGYQERYAEYRYKPSKITGKFRSDASGTIDLWHLSQDFADTPELGQTFIEENVPVSRVIAVPSEPHFIFDSFFDMICVRPMPVYSVPGNIDHF